MSEPMLKETWNSFLETRKELGHLEQIILNRLHYVIDRLLHVIGYNGKINYWFDGAQEGEIGELEIYEGYIGNIVWDGVPCQYTELIGDSIPIEYLFSNDFEEEFKAEIKREQESEKKKKEDQKKKRQEYMAKKKIVDKILSAERKKLMKEIKV